MSIPSNTYLKNIWTVTSNIFVLICCVLGVGAIIHFSVFYFTAPEKVRWETTSVTGTIIGSYHTPSQYNAPQTYIRVKLASGETVLIKDKGNLPLVIKGQQVMINRGTIDSEQFFYRFANSSQNGNSLTNK